jgi:hypothetical protein
MTDEQIKILRVEVQLDGGEFENSCPRPPLNPSVKLDRSDCGESTNRVFRTMIYYRGRNVMRYYIPCKHHIHLYRDLRVSEEVEIYE